jgi:hypothetical protein
MVKYLILGLLMNTLEPPADALSLRTFFTWMGSDGICRTVTKPQAEIDLDAAKQNTEAVFTFYTDRKFPLLVDARNVKSMTREARQHLSINGRETLINSFAILFKSPLSRVIGNFFMGINRPSVPARVFDNETLALQWLKNFL